MADLTPRTIWEFSRDEPERWLVTDLDLFQRKVVDALVFENSEHPTMQSAHNPRFVFVSKNQPECQRYGTQPSS